MRNFKYAWVAGIILTGLIIIVPVVLFVTDDEQQASDPWDNVPEERQHVDHSSLLQGPFETGSDVTLACLECHEDAAHDVMATSHWTWLSEPIEVEGRDELVSVGKANSLNNFCIGIQGNWQGCTRCHAGYGWDSADFDFTNEENVDCLVCHDQSGLYVKASAGLPAEGVDLELVAQSVGSPTRENCGGCHFNGGGGDGVKHGDLDETLYFPSESLDVHMGKLDFECIDCHRTSDHSIAGRSISVSLDDANQVQCTDCHSTDLHEDDRITAHVDTVACQTCHIPTTAREEPTKVTWDWSQAGRDDIEEDHYVYLKIKGAFVYEDNIVPEYTWYNGVATRYINGDPIDPTQVTNINTPQGSIDDPDSRIWPFKIHRAIQPYDPVYNILLQPKTVGEGGYWTDFDWDQAFELGSEAAGLPYSGEYDWTRTDMYWPQTHMVAPSSDALQCSDCHGEGSRMDWQALGYPGDPMNWGGRD